MLNPPVDACFARITENTMTLGFLCSQRSFVDCVKEQRRDKMSRKTIVVGIHLSRRAPHQRGTPHSPFSLVAHSSHSSHLPPSIPGSHHVARSREDIHLTNLQRKTAQQRRSWNQQARREESIFIERETRKHNEKKKSPRKNST